MKPFLFCGFIKTKVFEKRLYWIQGKIFLHFDILKLKNCNIYLLRELIQNVIIKRGWGIEFSLIKIQIFAMSSPEEDCCLYYMACRNISAAKYLFLELSA